MSPVQNTRPQDDAESVLKELGSEKEREGESELQRAVTEPWCGGVHCLTALQVLSVEAV